MKAGLNTVSTIKRILRPLLIIAIIGFAFVILIPQLRELPMGLAALRQGRWTYLLIALCGSFLTFLAEVWMIRVSLDKPPPWIKTYIFELATFFAATVTPAGLGWIALNQRYFEYCGNDRDSSRTALTLFILLTLIADILAVMSLLPLIPTLSIPQLQWPQIQVIIESVLVLLAIIGLLLWVPLLRRKFMQEAIPVILAFPTAVNNPKRSFLMIIAAISSNVAYAIALEGTIAAFGESVPFIGVFLANIIASVAAKVSPTPGGLGATELALVAILNRLGMLTGPAVAAVLSFRIITFWLPLPLGGIALHLARKRRWIFG